MKVLVSGRCIEIRGDSGTKRYPLGIGVESAVADYTGVKPVEKQAATPKVESVAEVATVAEVKSKKYTKETLVDMNKSQLMGVCKEMGIDKIDGKYLTACKVADIEDAILAKQGE